MQGAVRPASLDSVANSDEDDELSLYSVLGFEEKGYREVEQQDMIQRTLMQLTESERFILVERFFHNRSQREVADLLGVSQMTISRNERKAIEHFRTLIEE